MRSAIRYHLAERLRAVAAELAGAEESARAEYKGKPEHIHAFIAGWLDSTIRRASVELLEYADILRPKSRRKR